MPDEEEESMMEVLTIFSEVKTFLARRVFHESNSKCRSIDRDLGTLMSNNGCARQLKTPACSTNDSSK